jgi:hypothetical protein
LHRARALLKHQFRLEVEKELTEKETEPWEIIYFKQRASGSVYARSLAVDAWDERLWL